MNPFFIDIYSSSLNKLNIKKEEKEQKKFDKKTSDITALSSNSSSFSNNIFFKDTNLNQVNELRKNLISNNLIFNFFKENQNSNLFTNSKSFSHSFHINFNNLRIKLGIEDTRKTHIDSLLKKI